VIAKNTGYYLYAVISDIHVVSGSNNVSIRINKNIVDQHLASKLFNVEAYRWQKGDRIRFVLNRKNGDTFYTLPYNLDMEIVGELLPGEDPSVLQFVTDGINGTSYVFDVKGNKIPNVGYSGVIVSGFNYSLYKIEANNTIVEIYRPVGINGDPEYFEYGEPLPIIDPHTELRRHGGMTLDQDVSPDGVSLRGATGEFEYGDSYMTNRNTLNVFPVERKNFSDFYPSDALSIGQSNMENRNMRFQQFISHLRFGGRLIQDTRVNDMSRFLASDTIELKSKNGPIASIMEVGDVLKIHQSSKVSSILIGRAGLTQPVEEGTQIITSTKDVLGTVVEHVANNGTVHRGSVVSNGNRHYFFDFHAAGIIRDPGNGMQNLTEQYGLKRFMAEYCRLWGSPDNVEVISGFDQENSLIWWTFISTAGSFTLAFRDNGGTSEDGFAMFAQFIPEQYGMSKYTATVFKDNALWLMNSDNVPRCNFFGTQYKYWFTPVFGKGPLTMKRWLQILLNSPRRFSAPDAGDVQVPISGNSPAGMVSLLKPAAFSPVNGKWVADFGKNMTTKSLTPSNADLVNGSDLTGQCLTVRLEGSETVEHTVMAVEVNGVAYGNS